jgi:predicted RNA-binding protein Jag
MKMAENVTPMPIEEKMKKASTTLATMLDYLGLEANVKAEDRNGRIALIAVSEDAGRIIGRKGQTLDHLQLLVNRMVQRNDTESPRITIDVDGYSKKPREMRGRGGEDRGRGGEDRGRSDDRGDRDERRGDELPGGRDERGGGRGNERRGRERDGGERNSGRRFSEQDSSYQEPSDEEHEARIRQQAIDASKEVKRWGESVTLPPMNSHDRRIVHITLKEDTEIKTESSDSDESNSIKSVIVSLNKKES